MRDSWFAVLTAACLMACGKPATPTGEVRGLPSATTAYARVMSVRSDSLNQVTATYCRTLADSVESLPLKVPNAWTVLEREDNARINRKCRGATDELDCRLSSIGPDVLMRLAQRPLSWDPPACPASIATVRPELSGLRRHLPWV